MTLPGRPAAPRSGAALIEFSTVATLLMLLLFSTIEFERLLLVYSSVAQSARAGARYAVVHGATQGLACGVGKGGGCACAKADDCPSGPTACTDPPPPQVAAIVKTFASTGLLDASQLKIVVCYTPLSNSPGSTVTVKVSYPYDPFVGWFGQLKVNLASQTAGVITF